MNPVILERLIATTGRLGPYVVVSDEAADSKIARCQKELQSHCYRLLEERDTQNDEPQEVRQWLRELPTDSTAEVVVLWPADRCGIAMEYRGFALAYDDLWFPSADDVWVRPTSGGWLLEMDHEEVFRFFELSLRGGGASQ